jgi:Tol biopolymer transport system component
MGLPAGRVAIASAVGAVALVVAFAVLLVARDDVEPARGDLIAYGCDEPDLAWYAICVVKTDGTARRQLTHGLEASDPSWSPDGRRIVFTRHRSGGERVSFQYDELYVVDSAGESVRKLTDNRTGFTIAKPSWSPDGRFLAFVRGRTLPSAGVTLGAVFVMNEDGTGVRRITRGPLDSSPEWSPDGTRIVFTRAEDYTSFANADVYVVGASGGEARRLTTTAHRLETEPVWSPDGRSLVFATATPRTQFNGRAALHVMGSAGGGQRRLADVRLFSRQPGNLAWSPDGRAIALELSTAEGCTTIGLLRLDNVPGVVHPLLPCAEVADGASAPAWQPFEGTGAP